MLGYLYRSTLIRSQVNSRMSAVAPNVWRRCGAFLLCVFTWGALVTDPIDQMGALFLAGTIKHEKKNREEDRTPSHDRRKPLKRSRLRALLAVRAPW